MTATPTAPPRGLPNGLEAQALALLARLELPAEARILWLGERVPPPDVLPAGTRWRLERRSLPDTLERSREPADESFAAAVILAGLEALEYDRWAVQQVHRLVKPGGWLLLVVPNLTAAFSPGALGFAAARALARLARFAGGGRGRTFAGRRYARAALERMLDSLHFEVETWSSHGFVPPAARPRGRAAGAVELGERHFVVARRLPGLAARVAAGSAPEPGEFVRRHEAGQRAFAEIRTRWLASNPALAGGPGARFEPAAHAGARVLVLAPHADDELVGSAGTLLQLVAHGARVTVLHATDGSASAAFRDAPEAVRTTLRLDEARAVGAALGAAELVFWKEDNRAFRPRPETVEQLARLLRELEPELIFTPFVTDIHPDHFTLNLILAQALAAAPFDAGRCRILYSEIWSVVPATAWCDITAEEEQVERLIEMYTTAMKIDDLPHVCEARAYFNACRLLGRPGFVEVFFSAPAAQHRALMDSVADRDA